ncbi:MAG: enoyl-CoA hydratase/isomerase family protein [Burkholderiales bacterium]|jgi:methylglutaconyl-CoA hydratase
MSDFETIQVEQEQKVARVWLNRPDVRNAFNEQMIAELTEAFSAIDKDSSSKVMVLSGRGSAFCAGADLNWMRKMSGYSFDENCADASRLALMLRTLYEMKKPTIACVNGHAFAGGMGLVSACDIAVSVDSALFCLSETKLGLIPATIGPYVFSAVGRRAATRYMVSAERFDAIEAKRIGLVHEAVSDSQVQSTVDSILENILLGGTNAHRETKSLIDLIDRSMFSDVLINETATRIARVRASEEGKEGIQSFLEKRKPNWIDSN